MAQLANELGIALGLTVLGSLGTVVYRLQLGDAGSDARRSVIDGVREGQRDPALLASVKDAFTDSFHAVGLVGIVLMAVVLVLVARATRVPTATASPEPVGERELEEAAA